MNEFSPIAARVDETDPPYSTDIGNLAVLTVEDGAVLGACNN